MLLAFRIRVFHVIVKVIISQDGYSVIFCIFRDPMQPLKLSPEFFINKVFPYSTSLLLVFSIGRSSSPPSFTSTIPICSILVRVPSGSVTDMRFAWCIRYDWITGASIPPSEAAWPWPSPYLFDRRPRSSDPPPAHATTPTDRAGR